MPRGPRGLKTAAICDDRRVLARRLLLFASLLLLVSALSSALRPREDDGSGGRSNPAVPAGSSERVRASLPADDPVRADVGDVVELTVRTEEAERAEIRDLGIDGPADPGLPATLLVLADRPGEFPVTLRYSGLRVGTLEVRVP